MEQKKTIGEFLKTIEDRKSKDNLDKKKIKEHLDQMTRCKSNSCKFKKMINKTCFQCIKNRSESILVCIDHIKVCGCTQLTASLKEGYPCIDCEYYERILYELNQID